MITINGSRLTLRKCLKLNAGSIAANVSGIGEVQKCHVLNFTRVISLGLNIFCAVAERLNY
jgi:hypothetical protein